MQHTPNLPPNTQGGASLDPNMTKILTGEGGGGGGATARVEEGAADDAAIGEAVVPNLSSKDHAEASLIWVFHLLLALAGAYMAMVITNWGNPDGVPDGKTDATAGRESMWLKIVAQWLTMLLYMWSLWAPVCRGEGEDSY
jgi:hypothetical protein